MPTIPDKFLFPLPGQTLESRLVILVAVLISVATTFMTVRQSTKRGMTPQMTPDNPMAQSQKYMAYIVPLFALSGLYWQFGLVMYWVTTNVWTLGQQYVLFKRYPMPAVAGAPAAARGQGDTSRQDVRSRQARAGQGGTRRQEDGARRQDPWRRQAQAGRRRRETGSRCGQRPGLVQRVGDAAQADQGTARA